jgi:hypothetical protein
MKTINTHLDVKEVIRQFNQNLVTELTQSRRFTVLDREYTEAFINERNLVLSADAPLSEQMKVGEALGVDYLLLGTISELNSKTSSHYIKALDETTYSSSTYFKADFRIMVMATRQIKWSDTVKITTHQIDVDAILEQAAKKIIHSSLDNIYPIKILKVAGKKSIYLNQGGKMTALGDQFEVYTRGEAITDPDTGLKIKIDGERVATVEITKVQAKYSLAKLLSGKLNHIQSGAILRKVTTTHRNKKPPQQRVMQPTW